MTEAISFLYTKRSLDSFFLKKNALSFYHTLDFFFIKRGPEGPLILYCFSKSHSRITHAV